MGRKSLGWEEIEIKYKKEDIEDLYLDKKLNKEEICNIIKISKNTLNKILNHYNITRDRYSVLSEKLNNKNSKKQSHFQELISKISKEDIIKWYIEEDNDYKDAPNHFNITQYAFDKICKYYNIKKDRSKSKYKGIESSKDKYGEENFNLPEYSHEKDFAPNLKFEKLLINNNIQYEREFIIGTKAFDFKVGNTLIEINPTITHNSLYNPYNKDSKKGKDINYHYNKSKLAKENGYRCIHIWDWDDDKKIIRMLKKRESLYARKCIIKEPTRHEVEDFLNNYHLQGNARHSIRIGLYYNNNLVSVMTFSKSRYNKNYEYELIRYCSCYNVTGGAEKLFNSFINKYHPKSVISYCDNSKFNGETYLKIGFKLKNKGTPTRHWYNIKTKHHITDMLLRKNGFSRLIHHCEANEDNLDTNDNKELMLKEGFLYVYDCGQSSYVWESK